MVLRNATQNARLEFLSTNRFYGSFFVFHYDMDFVSNEMIRSIRRFRMGWKGEKIGEEKIEWFSIQREANDEKRVEQEERIKLFVHSDSDSRFLLLIFSRNVLCSIIIVSHL